MKYVFNKNQKKYSVYLFYMYSKKRRKAEVIYSCIFVYCYGHCCSIASTNRAFWSATWITFIIMRAVIVAVLGSSITARSKTALSLLASVIYIRAAWITLVISIETFWTIIIFFISRAVIVAVLGSSFPPSSRTASSLLASIISICATWRTFIVSIETL